MEFLQHYSLLTMNTLAIDATAENFVRPDCEEDVQECLQFAKSNNLVIKVLGGGSNVVMSNQVSGLVLQFCGNACCILKETEESATIKVEAGYNWHEFVMFSLSQGWFGLENLAYIPGNVGAAPVQNIGAYGVEVKDRIGAVNGVYLDSGELFSLAADECDFAYRESRFKQGLNGKVLITSVEFRLSKKPQVQVSYAPLNNMADEKGLPTPSELAQWVIQVRQSKLPEPKELPNAGSFFKNPVVSQAAFKHLIERFPKMPGYPQPNGVKLAAGWLIDQLGFKGKAFGPVAVHQLQALVLVNHGGSGEDVLSAARQVSQAVFECYGVELEQEPRLFS